ncbi:MAG: hypothetical protein H7175_14600, partial [Burkholderiales bacterium]|nr:hypothetical protein [Anaerolineae bacterium]
MLEYGLLLSLVGLVVLPILLLFGGSLSDTYQKLVCSLDGSSPACSCELYEVITKGPANVCVGGTFAFEALTSCGSNTSLSLYVEYDAGDTHDVGLSYEIPNDIFSTAFADNINLCETIRDGEVDARLVSRHHEDDIVNIFPISLSAGTVGMGPGEETPEATQDPEATELPEATEEPMTCPELLDVAFTALEQNCNGLGRHSACYGYNVVFATFSQPMPDDHFSVPSDRTELLNLYTLHTTAFAPEIDQWGIAMMNVQANLPNTLPGQSVVLLMVGDAEVENGVQSDRAVVPADPVSVRTNYDTGARSAPSVNANIVATLADNTQVGADGIDASGEWLRVWHQNVPVWLRRTAVTDSASLDDLPVLDAESDTPMEVFRLTTSPLGELSCDPVPNVLLVQNPESTLVTLSVNGTNVTIGSTVAMRTDQATGDLEVLVLDGNATVNGVALPSCHRGVVTGGVWTGVRGMTAAEQTEMEVLEDVPAGLLHYPVNVCAPATPPTPPPTLPLSIAGTLVATSSTCTRAIDWNGSNNTISGGVHSNRDIRSGGSGNQIYGDTTYVTTIDSSGFVFYDYPYPSGAAGNSPLQVGLQSDPLGLNVNRFAPGGDIAIAAQAQGRYYNCNCKMDKGWFESQGYYNDATGEL